MIESAEAAVRALNEGQWAEAEFRLRGASVVAAEMVSLLEPVAVSPAVGRLVGLHNVVHVVQDIRRSASSGRTVALVTAEVIPVGPEGPPRPFRLSEASRFFDPLEDHSLGRRDLDHVDRVLSNARATVRDLIGAVKYDVRVVEAADRTLDALIVVGATLEQAARTAAVEPEGLEL